VPLVLVPPVEEEDVLRHLRDEVRVVPEDVGPHHHAAPVLRRELPQAGDVVDVDAADADLVRQDLGAAQTHVPRLVRVHVEPGGAAGSVRDVRAVGREVGEELPEEAVDEGEGGVVGARKAPAPVGLGQVGVLGQAEGAAVVAEGLEVGDEGDVALAAKAIEGEQVVPGEGAGPLRDLGVARKPEGVLDVELELVHLVVGDRLDQGGQRLQGEDLAAGDVEHQAADGEGGAVLDPERGPAAVVPLRQLD
jgi:hypothetical protein